MSLDASQIFQNGVLRLLFHPRANGANRAIPGVSLQTVQVIKVIKLFHLEVGG
jgi:hypothetical protein